MWLDNIIQDILDRYNQGDITAINVPDSWLEEFESTNGEGSLQAQFPNIVISKSGSNKLEFI